MGKRRIVSFLLMIGLLPLWLSEASARPLVLNTLHNPPLEQQQDKIVAGALAEIVTEAVRRTGRRVLIRIRPWKRAQMEVEKGIADGCFNTGDTGARRQWAFFHSESLFDETYVLFVRRHDQVRLSADMANAGGFRAGIQSGYAYGGIFQEALDHRWFKRVEEAQTIRQNIVKLTLGRIDLFAGDRIPTLHFLGAEGVRPQVDILRDPATEKQLIVSVWPTYVAFSRKNVAPAYVEKFNAALVQIKREGVYHRILEKYMAQPRPGLH